MLSYRQFEDKSTTSKKRQLEKLLAVQDKNYSRLAEVQAEISATDEKISSLKKEIAVDEALALAEIVLGNGLFSERNYAKVCSR